jgi:hypothetical protein
MVLVSSPGQFLRVQENFNAAMHGLPFLIGSVLSLTLGDGHTDGCVSDIAGSISTAHRLTKTMSQKQKDPINAFIERVSLHKKLVDLRTSHFLQITSFSIRVTG